MPDPASIDSTARAIKKLSIAMWIIAVVMVANLLISLVALFSPAFIAKRMMATLPEMGTSSEPGSLAYYNNFHEWPVEKKVQAASVIAVAKWEKSDSTMKCVISEILKQAPNTTFYYKVGDEFRPGNRQIRDNTSYGDGQVLFFTGSPASFRYSTSYTDDRIAGSGDMPITELRELIGKSNK